MAPAAGSHVALSPTLACASSSLWGARGQTVSWHLAVNERRSWQRLPGTLLAQGTHTAVHSCAGDRQRAAWESARSLARHAGGGTPRKGRALRHQHGKRLRSKAVAGRGRPHLDMGLPRWPRSQRDPQRPTGRLLATAPRALDPPPETIPPARAAPPPAPLPLLPLLSLPPPPRPPCALWDGPCWGLTARPRKVLDATDRCPGSGPLPHLSPEVPFMVPVISPSTARPVA